MFMSDNDKEVKYANIYLYEANGHANESGNKKNKTLFECSTISAVSRTKKYGKKCSRFYTNYKYALNQIWDMAESKEYSNILPIAGRLFFVIPDEMPFVT